MKQNFAKFWKRWKELSARAAAFQGRILLMILFFTLLAPIGLILSKKRPRLSTYWEDKNKKNIKTLEGLKHQ